MNFEKLFKDYNLDYSTKTNRGWVNLKCPYCGGSSYKFGFNPKEDYCTCFACGSHPLRKSLSIVLSVPLKDLDDVLINYQGRNGVLNELNEKKSPKPVKLELPTDTFISAERKYLKSRGFNPSYLNEKYNVVGGGMTGSWKYRIIIPLIVGGRIVSWTGRSILSKEECERLKIPRYKNLSRDNSIYSKEDLFYNLDYSSGDTVILTEGPFDVMRLGDKNGYSDNVICSLGTQMTQKQIMLLGQKYKKVFILFDNEPEAQNKARKFGIQISAIGVDVEVVDAYSDFNVKDGGECNQQQVDYIRKELLGE